jgi:hypothetical protein
MDSSVSPKDETWFLRVCHHISDTVYVHAFMVSIIRDCVISVFRRKVEENCALSGYYTAISGQFRIDDSRQHIGPIFKGKNLKMGPTGCTETPVRNWPLLAA